MNFETGDIVIVYGGKGSGLFYVSSLHAALFDLLEKIGIKSSPVREYAIWSGGTYTTTITLTDIKIPVEEPTPPKKKFGKPGKETRREWRSFEKTHSRNTGRKIGRR